MAEYFPLKYRFETLYAGGRRGVKGRSENFGGRDMTFPDFLWFLLLFVTRSIYNLKKSK